MRPSFRPFAALAFLATMAVPGRCGARDAAASGRPRRARPRRHRPDARRPQRRNRAAARRRSRLLSRCAGLREGAPPVSNRPVGRVVSGAGRNWRRPAREPSGGDRDARHGARLRRRRGVRRLAAGDPAGGGEPRRQFRHRRAGGDRRAHRRCRCWSSIGRAAAVARPAEARPLRAVSGRRISRLHRPRPARAAGGAWRRRPRRSAARHRRRRGARSIATARRQRSGSAPDSAGRWSSASRSVAAAAPCRRPTRCCSSPSPARRSATRCRRNCRAACLARQVISWVVVLALPISVPLSFAWRPADPGAVAPLAWASLAYLGAMSMYLGFFAWNAGLALGGVARVGQVQLVQPFLTLRHRRGAAWRTDRRRDGDLRARRRRARLRQPADAGRRPADGGGEGIAAMNGREAPERIRAAPKSGPSQGERPKGHCDDRRVSSLTPVLRPPI